MSYSRWSNSRWYTFWCTPTMPFKKDNVFEICGDGLSFTYDLLVSNIDSCLKEVKNKLGENGCTDEELKELKGYMEEFIEDVDEEYKTEARKKFEKGEITKEEYFLEDL